ncbi:hypothetical protein ACTXT7_013089 [Hymenolepis weldensis]
MEALTKLYQLRPCNSDAERMNWLVKCGTTQVQANADLRSWTPTFSVIAAPSSNQTECS